METESNYEPFRLILNPTPSRSCSLQHRPLPHEKVSIDPTLLLHNCIPTRVERERRVGQHAYPGLAKTKLE